MPTLSLRWKTPLTLIGRGREYNKDGSFRPYINVLRSQLFPQPIFAAVITKAPWRWLRFPDEVLRRSEEAQLGYVKWRCQYHFRATNGQCYLFGRITGFEWVKTPNEIVVLDTRGRVVGKAEQATPSGHGSLRIGNKTLPDSILG
jgi:hypothetical protein